MQRARDGLLAPALLDVPEALDDFLQGFLPGRERQGAVPADQRHRQPLAVPRVLMGGNAFDAGSSRGDGKVFDRLHSGDRATVRIDTQLDGALHAAETAVAAHTCLCLSVIRF